MTLIRPHQPRIAIRWSAAMATGIPRLDEQRRRVAGLTNALILLHSMRRHDLIPAALDELQAHVATQFAAEEQWVQPLGYATFAAHARAHHRLRQSIDQLWASRATPLPEDVLTSLAEQITEHLLEEAAELPLVTVCV